MMQMFTQADLSPFSSKNRGDIKYRVNYWTDKQQRTRTRVLLYSWN